MSPLGVAVIGLGNMGLRHARAYQQIDGVRLEGVCDIDQKRIDQARGSLGDVFAATDLSALLEKREIEAVSICVPENSHLLPVRKVAEREKHMLIEKPLADNLEDARKIVDALNGYTRKVMVGHLLRFDPRYSGAFKLIREGEIGDMVYVRGLRSSIITGPHYYRGKASLPFHLAVHDIDLIHWYNGSKVDTVYAAGRSKALAGLGIDDCVFSILTYRNETIAQMEHSWIMPSKYPPTLDSRMELIGTKGMIQIDLKNQGLAVYRDDRADIINTSYFFERADGSLTGCLVEQLKSFIHSVIRDSPVAVSLQEAYENVKVAQAIADSAHQKRVIRLKDKMA